MEALFLLAPPGRSDALRFLLAVLAIDLATHMRRGHGRYAVKAVSLDQILVVHDKLYYNSVKNNFNRLRGL